MGEEDKQNEHYDVSISDWITILQDKTSTSKDILIFMASTILATIVAVPQLIRDVMGSNMESWIMTLIIIIILYIVFVYYYNKSLKEHKPYKELLNDILYGEITKMEIRKKYKEIEEREN